MPDTPKRYWMSVVERDFPGPSVHPLENGDPDFAPTRRSFLKAAGFTSAPSRLPAVAPPRVDAIPYVQQPDGLVPGRPLFYATTCGACEARCGLLVTTRDGRPSKSKAIPIIPFSGGSDLRSGPGVDPRACTTASGWQFPTKAGQQVAWADVDTEIMATLDRLKQEGRAVRILTSTDHQPDDGGGDRRLPGRLRQRASRHLRSDFRLGHPRGARADARRARHAALPLRSGRRDRQLRRRFPRHVDLSGAVHPRILQPTADQRNATRRSLTTCRSNRGCR